MSENSPPAVAQQPQKGKRKPAAPRRQPGVTTTNSIPSPPSTPTATAEKEPPPSSRKPKKQWRNGYKASPKTPSYRPYTLEQKGRKRVKPFSFDDGPPAKQARKAKKVSVEGWNKLAHKAGVLPADATLRDFQTQLASHILANEGDACVIAPTGAGKSMLWCLPVLAQSRAISLVITPYTSLGSQGELEYVISFYRALLVAYSTH